MLDIEWYLVTLILNEIFDPILLKSEFFTRVITADSKIAVYVKPSYYKALIFGFRQRIKGTTNSGNSQSN